MIDRDVLKDQLQKRPITKKAYSLVPYSWILETLRVTDVAENIREFSKLTITDWKTVLASCREELGKVGIRKMIFRGTHSQWGTKVPHGGTSENVPVFQ